MPAKAVQISLDVDLLKQIDESREAHKLGRSAFFKNAARAYLRARRKQAIDEAIRRAYAGSKRAALEEIEDLIGGQAWPDE